MRTYIGIDISKEKFDVYYPNHKQQYYTFPNTVSGYKVIFDLIKGEGLENVIAVFEPTGGYEKGLKKYFLSKNINYQCVHTNKVRFYAKSLGMFAKNDRIDARLLSEYGKHYCLDGKLMKYSPEEEELQILLRRRWQLSSEATREKNRLDKEVGSLLKKSITSHLCWLKKEISKIENLMKKTTKKHDKMREKIDIITSIPGVGIYTAVTILAELPEIHKGDSKQLASLVGVVPFCKDSGRKKGKRSIYGGREQVRKMLYMSSVSCLKANPIIKNFYHKLINAGKPAKVALVACMRRLLCFIVAMLKNNKKWNIAT